MKPVYGRHIQFCKFMQNCYKTNYKTFYFSDFSLYSKKVCGIWTRLLCHFQNGALHFCTSKTDEVIKQFVNVHPFLVSFAKIALVTIYMLQTLKTWCYFFQKEPFYLLKIFLELISMVKVHKIAEMCQIFGYFSFYYCKSLNNTFLS